MRRFALALLVLALAACGEKKPEDAPAADAAATTSETTEATTAADDASGDAAVTASEGPLPEELSPAGFGPYRIGMSGAQVSAAGGFPLPPPLESEDSACREALVPPGAPGAGLFLMIEDDVLTRITDSGHGQIKTHEGVGAGSTDAEVRRAYPGAIEQPAKYDAPPAHDLVVWTDAAHQNGIRFEVTAAGKVAIVHAGGPAILYVEGCA